MTEHQPNDDTFRWVTPLTIPLLERLTDTMPISVQAAANLIQVGRIILNGTWTAEPTLMTLVRFLTDKSFRDHTVHQTRDVAMMLAWTEWTEVNQMITLALADPLRAVLR